MFTQDQKTSTYDLDPIVYRWFLLNISELDLFSSTSEKPLSIFGTTFSENSYLLCKKVRIPMKMVMYHHFSTVYSNDFRGNLQVLLKQFNLNFFTISFHVIFHVTYMYIWCRADVFLITKYFLIFSSKAMFIDQRNSVSPRCTKY